MIPNVRTCVRCIMDETARDIEFDEEGVCNYCAGFLHKQTKHIAPTEEERQRRLNGLVEMVKRSGRGSATIASSAFREESTAAGR